MAGSTGCVPRNFLLAQIMGKRSSVFFAVLLFASVARVELPVAVAQSAGSDTFDCASGVISSVDGSCVSEDAIPSQGLGQLGGTGTSAGAGGVGVAAGQLGGQYPGLQSAGMNSRVQSIPKPN